MKYTIDVTNAAGELIETVSGEDVNNVLKRVFVLESDVYYLTTAEKNNLRRDLAYRTTQKVQKTIEQQSDLLKKSLVQRLKVSWNFLLSDFLANNHEPKLPDPPPPPKQRDIPTKPDRDADKYMPELTLRDRLSSYRKQKKLYEAENLYKQDYAEWEIDKNKLEIENSEIQSKYKLKVDKLLKEHYKAYKEWEKKRNKIYADQKKYERDYAIGGIEGTQKYFKHLLLSSRYKSNFFKKKVFIRYFPDNKLLFVEYNLPDKKDLTNVKEVKYITNKKEFQEVQFSEAQMNKKYDDTLYQITLRSLYEIFTADTKNKVDQVVFNGVVDTVDPSTGQKIQPCIISISVSKETFNDLNLDDIVPKECFKGLKGVSAAKLHTISPVAPVMQVNTEDKRFVDSYSVTPDIDHQTNLAAMDWEDFEHLIREVFEKEFSQGGGEVKVTQASRDGGVDAIAFDPDPIRGGKIVIQAKRYTNIVGVAAVRDLYGTVMNEGATKGILVTTANYGSDAYEFANGKPLTLLNGANLLSLLEKHGYKAIINLKQAKKILAEKESEKNK